MGSPQIDPEALKRYWQWVEAWKKVQADVSNNLKALVIILDKFLLFAGAEKKEAADVDICVDRLLQGFNGVAEHGVSKPVNAKEALELLTKIRKAPRARLQGVSPLTANIAANMPGAITRFLQRQSDKMLQITCEIRETCQSFRSGTLQKMQQVYEAVLIQINRKMYSLRPPECDMAQCDSVCRSYGEIAEEIETLLQLISGLDIYPSDNQRIQNYIHEISIFKLKNLEIYPAGRG